MQFLINSIIFYLYYLREFVFPFAEGVEWNMVDQ